MGFVHWFVWHNPVLVSVLTADASGCCCDFFGPDLSSVWLDFHKSLRGNDQQVPIVESTCVPDAANLAAPHDRAHFLNEFDDRSFAEADE